MRLENFNGGRLVAIAQALPDGVDNGHGDRDRVLALALSAALNAPIEPSRFGVFRM